MSFQSTDFRKTLARYATGVAVALTKDAEGRIQGVTLNSLISVSLDPPLVLFCLKKFSWRCDLFEKSKAFSLNFLASDQKHIANQFAKGNTPFSLTSDFFLSSSFIPYLQGCTAHLECEIESLMNGGDHQIFLCRVICLECAQDKKPLIFYQSQFVTVDLSPNEKDTTK